jgi:hypothetical protein
MSGLKRDRDRRPARGAPSREPKRRLLIVSEGECTEPEYLHALKRHLKNPAVELQFHGERGDPKKLVEMAKEAKAKAAREAERQGDPLLRYDEVWCVFDRDDHERFDAAIDQAQKNHLKVAASNPCFELWLLLHLRESPGAQDRKTLARMLRGMLSDYDKHPPFERLKAGLDDAMRRAERLDRDAEARGDRPRRNPSTGVYLLVRSMRADAPCFPAAPQS